MCGNVQEKRSKWPSRPCSTGIEYSLVRGPVQSHRAPIPGGIPRQACHYGTRQCLYAGSHLSMAPMGRDCLLVISVSVALIAMEGSNNTSTMTGKNDGSSDTNKNKFLGLGAVLLACVLSALAGVYFEYVIKTPTTTTTMTTATSSSQEDGDKMQQPPPPPL